MSTSPFAPVLRDELSAPFFDGTAEGRLLIRRCNACGHVRGFEVPICTECYLEPFEWIPSSGTGQVVSWVVMHSRAGADGVVPEPRIVATVELSEGPWMVSALLGVAPDAVAGGMSVHIAFERPDGSEAIPVFHPTLT